MSIMCVRSCRYCVWAYIVPPVAILSAGFCVICSVLMFVPYASGDHMGTRAWLLLWLGMWQVFFFHMLLM